MANGLDQIRDRLVADQIPWPTSARYRGAILDRRDLARTYLAQQKDPS